MLCIISSESNLKSLIVLFSTLWAVKGEIYILITLGLW